MSQALRVLLVEDSPDDELLLIDALRRGGYAPTVHRVENAEELSAALQAGEWDVILSDYSLPGFNALSALAITRATAHDLPFIVVSGTFAEDQAIEALKLGANDYLHKQNLKPLVASLEHEL